MAQSLTYRVELNSYNANMVIRAFMLAVGGTLATQERVPESRDGLIELLQASTLTGSFQFGDGGRIQFNHSDSAIVVLIGNSVLIRGRQAFCSACVERLKADSQLGEMSVSVGIETTIENVTAAVRQALYEVCSPRSSSSSPDVMGNS